jgi:hypothetical protein
MTLCQISLDQYHSDHLLVVEMALDSSPHSTGDKTYGKCIEEYNAKGDNELSLKPGDIVRLLSFDPGSIGCNISLIFFIFGCFLASFVIRSLYFSFFICAGYHLF